MSDEHMRDAIPLPVDQEPTDAIVKIAEDLINNGDNYWRRQGRRLLGAVDALWAEAGAEIEEQS